MRSLEELRDEIILKYVDKVNLTSNEVEVILNFIVDEFSTNFPLLKGKLINSPPKDGKLFLDEIDTELLEIKGIMKISSINQGSIGNKYEIDQLSNQSGGFINLEEQVALSLYKEASSLYTHKNILIKPSILSETVYVDATDLFGNQIKVPIEKEFIVVNNKSVLFYTKRRHINKDNIPESIYKVLRSFVLAKFLNWYLAEMLETSNSTRMAILNKIREYIRNLPGYDGTNEPEDIIKSISVGSISISFGSKDERLDTLLNIVSKMLNAPSMDRVIVDNLVKESQKYQKKFKAAKVMYFSGIF